MTNRVLFTLAFAISVGMYLGTLSKGDAGAGSSTEETFRSEEARQCFRTNFELRDLNPSPDKNMIVELSVELYKNGHIDNIEVINRERFAQNEEYAAFAEKVKTAVISCAPYRLPPNLYQDWQSSVWRFDPSKMFGQ